MRTGRKSPTRMVIPLFFALALLVFVAALGQSPWNDNPSAEAAKDSYPALDPATINAPFPTDPPVLSLITAGVPDPDGYTQITGAAGAVPANAQVAVLNLSAHNVITGTADATGGFSVNLYAPAGSRLLINYETDTDRIQQFWDLAVSDVADDGANLNPLPGTMLLVPPPPTGDGQFQEFSAVGASWQEDPKGWAGWVLTGTLEVPPGGSPPGLRAQAGDTITITADLRVHTPGVACSVPVTTIDGSLHFRYLFNEQGAAAPWGMWFTAHLFTPTGLPIEHEASGEFPHLLYASFTNLHCVGPNTLTGQWNNQITIPADTPDGIYRPEMLILGIPPSSTQVPMARIWFHDDPYAEFPTILVGDPAPPQIPWTLLGDYLLNGHRGLTAREDAGTYAMPTRVVYPPHQVIIPRLDARTGDPLVYRLDPGSLWLSGTDRRFPPRPQVPLVFPSGEIQIEILKPDGSVDMLGPVPVRQPSVRTPTLPSGEEFAKGTGHIGEMFHITALDESFDYTFDQYGDHTIFMAGYVEDIFGLGYELGGTYDVTVARILDLDPGQLPTTPYQQGDHFSPGLHVFPPVPANIHIEVTHLPYSDPTTPVTTTFTGQASRYGIFQPDLPGYPPFAFEEPGEFRVDYTASYLSPDGTLWMGTITWGNVVEGVDADAPRIEAHGRRGMDYKSDTINDMPAWFTVNDLLSSRPDKIGIEMYYPYFSGDIHWGNENPDPPDATDSIHSILTFKEKPGVDNAVYNVLRDHFDLAAGQPRNCFRWPPEGCSEAGLEARIAIGEAPLFITTQSGVDPAVDPDNIDLMGYWYGSSQRPDVHVREIISEDGMGTAYWRFNDTYGYQIGEPADGDQGNDIKWEFGGIVLRTITDTNPLNEYAIYSSLWVLLPDGCDSFGCTRVTPPFRGAGALDGGPIMTLLGEDIDMLFLPKGVRPGDILELGDTFSFSGHVGPPLDSRVSITVTTPSLNSITGDWHANKIGWLYDPTFDFPVNEPGRWTVEVAVHHDRVYAPTGINPDDPPYNGQYNHGTVLGTHVYNNTYEFYVVAPGAPRLAILQPNPGFLPWPDNHIEPIEIVGRAPTGTTAVYYTIHDKGVVMGQGQANLDADGHFTFTYDADALHEQFPMLSLTGREAILQGLSDEVAINFLAVGTLADPQANTVTLIGEEVFVGTDAVAWLYLPATLKGVP